MFKGGIRRIVVSKDVGVLDSAAGNEPLIDAQAISASWGLIWPKVVARAWMEQDASSKSEWYQDLLSKDPERVRRSLIAVGFAPEVTYDISGVDPDKRDLTWFWENLKIIVKERGDGVGVETQAGGVVTSVPKNTSLSGQYEYSEPELSTTIQGDVEINAYTPSNGWKEMDGLEHVLVLTLPPKPAKSENLAIALAEYEATGRVYPFTFCC